MIKTNATGDTIWTKTYGGANSDYGKSVQQTSDGGYIIVGYSNSFGAGSNDVYLIKTNATGDTLWTKTYGGASSDYGKFVQQTSDGGYIIVGYSNSFGAGYDDVYLLKTNATGDTLWTKTYGGADYDYGKSIQQTSDGGYIITGGTYSFGAGSNDVYLLKTNATGDTLWTKTYGSISDDEGNSVQQTSDGGYIITGVNFIDDGTGDVDVLLIKTDVDGNVNGCSFYLEYYYSPSICMVTVDSTSGKYVLVWEKEDILSVNENITSYNLYKQKGTGIYELITTIPYNNYSTFIDSNSNSYEKSARYRISVIDTCGFESQLSSAHKTMHLSFGEGVNGVWNLMWDNYEGDSTIYYIIHRGGSVSAMAPIDTIQNDFTTYTDLSPPSGIVYYQIEAVFPTICTPTAKRSVYSSARSNYGTNDTTFLKQFTNYAMAEFSVDTTEICKDDTVNFINYSINANTYSWYFQGGTPNTSNQKNPSVVFSDTGSFDITLTVTNNNGSANESKPAYITVIDCSQDTTGIGFISNQDIQLFIYPNPSKNILNVEFNASTSEQLSINFFNIVGEKVLAQKEVSKAGANHFSVSTTNLTPGIYFLQLHTPTKRIIEKIAVE